MTISLNSKKIGCILLFLSFIIIIGAVVLWFTDELARRRVVESRLRADISAIIIPKNVTGIYPQNLTAKGVIIVDVDSERVLWEKNSDTPLLPASTVKMMTGIVASEKYSPDQYLSVDQDYENGQTMSLKRGEIISVRNLLSGLLISSANDAAMILAKNYPGGEMAFIEAMNNKAAELKMHSTYFANPTGLDSDDDKKLLPDFSYSTSADLIKLALAVIRVPLISELVKTQAATVSDYTGKISHNLNNINDLLGKVEGVLGVKTGWTEEAGECLVSITERNGKKIAISILGSADRFGETEKLINWVFSNYRWENN